MNWNGLTDDSFWYDRHRVIFNKDCRSMADLPNEYVQMVVTSPPYWGLRKYIGLPDLIWGGKKRCRHQWEKEIKRNTGTLGNNLDTLVGTQTADIAKQANTQGQFCSLCGAWKGQLGLEPMPEMYIEHLIQIFCEVRRVLRSDGVCFVNIGDSYFATGIRKNNFASFIPTYGTMGAMTSPKREKSDTEKVQESVEGLKPKDLCLIPFRLAIALQESGWWVRSVIIWNKPNPMPESVTDRPTESHEYILMLTKSSKYYYDQEAVREEYTEPLDRWGGDNMRKSSHKYIDTFEETGDNGGIGKIGATSMFREGRPVRPDESGRNRRSVWTFPTQPYPEAHFATYPEKLVEICVKAATPEVGCCNKCGKPWVRIVEKPKSPFKDTRTPGQHTPVGEDKISGGDLQKWLNEHPSQTLGWKPQCKCDADKVSSIVLDPFAGSGTTLKVAAELNRRAIGYELSQAYCDLAIERSRQAVMI